MKLNDTRNLSYPKLKKFFEIMLDICRSPIERNLSFVFINGKRKELYKLSYWDESVDKLPATTGEILEVKIRKLLTRKQRLRRGRDEGWRE